MRPVQQTVWKCWDALFMSIIIKQSQQYNHLINGQFILEGNRIVTRKKYTERITFLSYNTE